MYSKENLKQEEKRMKAMYSSEPSHLLRGMVVAIAMEAVAFGALVGVGLLLSYL